ncbi:MAG: response regulator transcription factor [Parabacteroides sp.]
MNRIKRYKIILIEPSPIVTSGLTEALKQTGEFVVTHTFNDTSGGMEAKIKTEVPDIVIIDPVIINYTERSSIRSFLGIPSDTALVAMVCGPYDDNATHAFDGCLSLYDSPAQIIRKLHESLTSIGHTPRTEHNGLTARERSILTAVAQGKSNKEIADEFNLSIYTVVTHRKNISRKLGIKSISGLTVYAIMNKLIDMRDI